MKKFGLKSVTATAFISCALAVAAQTASPSQPDMLQQKVQQMEQATVKNEQQLHTYQWVESTTLTIDGTTRPPKQSLCRYAADGTVVKTPVGSSDEPRMPGGPMKHIAEKKKEKVEDEVDQIHALMQLYLPFNQAKLQEVLRTGKVDLEHDGTNGDALILNNYAKPGDELRLALNPTTMRIEQISVMTYFDEPKDAMRVEIHFAILPDGTVYPTLTSIEAPSKKLSIETANSDFSKVVH
jgi:hypothetical protein